MGEDAEADASGAPTDVTDEGEPRPSSESNPSASATVDSDDSDDGDDGDDGDEWVDRADADPTEVIETEPSDSSIEVDDGAGSTSPPSSPAGTLEPPTDREGADAVVSDPEFEGDVDAIAAEVEEDPLEVRSGPEDDREMPLADHIEEMLKRLAIVIVVAGSVTIVTFPLAADIINFLWYSILPGTEVARPRVYGPLEFLLTQLKVASLAGLVVALPVFVYESYRFMRPGLYRHERRYYLAAVPTSLILAIVGVMFAYFVVLPAIFTYFLAYSEGAGEIAFALARTFDLILVLMGYLAIVFQIPLAIMLAIMMGITTRVWLQSKRLYFWGAFLGLSFISSPDPTGMAPIIIALTMVGLFEGTLLLLKWVGK